MKLSEVMTKHVQTIDPSETLLSAARQMKELDTGVLPVCENDRLIGMITDRDIVVRGLAVGIDPNSGVVRDIVSERVQYCFEDQSVEEAATLMREKKIRRIVILDRSKRLCGLVSLGDLATQGQHEDTAKEVLNEVSQPSNGTKKSVAA